MNYSIPNADGPLTLRAFTVDDVAKTFEWVTNPWYTGDFGGASIPTEDSHHTYFQGVLVDDGQIYLAVCVDGRHIGNAGLKYFEGDACECWYYIGDETQRGKGYANEIVKLLCEVAVTVDGLNTVKARVQKTNPKSWKALLTNGFVLQHAFTDSRGRECNMYAKALEG